MKKVKLYSIYKNGVHLGNEKGFSIEDAIKKYLIASSFESFLCDSKFVAKYSASLAIENVHFNKTVFNEK